MKRWRVTLLALAALTAAGCGSDRIDPPAGEDALGDGETAVAVDSLSDWARRAREGWSAADSTRAREAGALARETFVGVWADLQAGADEAGRVREVEHLPTRQDIALPSPEDVTRKLAGLGLAADIAAAEGSAPLWQVVLRDPTGGADAWTEFWAWPDPRAPLGPPVVQPLPANAPSRRRYGPEAVGALATYARGDGTGLASAWTRPRGTAGLEVALLSRGKSGTWKVGASRQIPVLVDSVAFLTAARGGGAPSLVVHGAGGRDRLFDECPTCPHLARRQRYQYEGEQWTLREESVTPSPYAAVVAFMHALREGGPDAALPYAAGPEVLEQVRELGFERGPIVPLRAAPGTLASDLTQRYRRGGSGGSDGLEITLAPRDASWVVADLRPTRLVIE